MKYILILAVLLMAKPVVAQKSDWTDADRLRFKKVCEGKVANMFADSITQSYAQESPELKDALLPLMKQMIPMACPCVEKEVNKKYPQRKNLFSFTDDQLATLIINQDEDGVGNCYENVIYDSTLNIGWSKEFKASFISFIAINLSRGAEGRLPEENCKNIATCFVDKLASRYPNPLYTLMKMGESNDENEDGDDNESATENEVKLLIYSCFGASSDGGK